MIDECHRSGFGKWSEILKRNANAVQIGLTATPRQLKISDTAEDTEDKQISADNYAYFGEPVYEYDLLQAVEDGYLSALQIIQNHVLILGDEEITGLTKNHFANAAIEDYCSGLELDEKVLKERYAAAELDRQIVLPERTQLLCVSLFEYLIQDNQPEQKTIIFCAGVDHARRVAVELNNLYAQWCKEKGRERLDTFAFPCTGEVGRDNLADFKGMKRSHFIATTADFLQAGVDVPWVMNIVFFSYLNSAIRFYQMVGRGTRLHAESGKIAFKIYDYTNATRLFGADFITKISKTSEKPKPPTGNGIDDPEPPPPLPTPSVTGLKIDIQKGEITVLVVGEDGKHTKVSLAEYQDRIKHLVLERLPTASAFVDEWITRSKNLLELPEIQTLLKYKEPKIDSFDVLLATAYQIPPKTKHERVADFLNNSEAWFATMPDAPANTLRALANVFDDSGTEGLTNQELFNVPHLRKVSGGSVTNAFKLVGKPNEVFKEFKTRIFTLTN